MEKRVLIVDDSPFDREILRNALERRGGFKVLSATDGSECLRILDLEPVDLVLMDIMMPGANGAQILMKIRARFNPIELPIIMVTAKADATDVIGCLKSGANDYINKPINLEIAITRMLTHLKLADLSRQMSRLQEIAALDALVGTYNHEINNPLAIALGCCQSPPGDTEAQERLKTALWRIADINKSIRDVIERKEIAYEGYVGEAQTLKITKKTP